MKRYPLAAKMSKNVFVCKPEFPARRVQELVRKFIKLLLVCKMLVISAKNILQLGRPLKKGWSFIRFHEETVREKSYIFSDNESFRPKKYSEDAQFVSAVETKTVEILGKFLKKEKDLIDNILGKDYKQLNRVFDVAQIKYGERPLPAYTRTVKLSIENVTKKKRAGG
jgi:hypothetical protein